MPQQQDAQPFQLKYSHNIIEHLGLKLYQNRPTNVLAELVSNSWDADSENVWIDIDANNLAVYDDGTGMDRETLVNHYLIIGKRKRTSINIEDCSPKNRKYMGRKGIGKLAPFGIAKRLSVVTVSEIDNTCCWLEVDLTELLKESNENELTEFSYKPEVIFDSTPISEITFEKDKHGYVKKFVEKIEYKSGTLIIMDDLSLKRKIPTKHLMESLGQRFTVTLLRDDFNVIVNDELVTEKQSLPEFSYREPATGFVDETININGIDRKVRHWVGFVREAEWPQDQAGVGVYAHGKIAQDRPFVFGLKGREISTRYMYGVIEADWLDELDEDIVSTDRTSINWNNDYTEEMYNWGKNLVSKWIANYRKFQKEENSGKVLRKIKELPDIPKITEEEREAIKDMVCNMSPKIYKDEQLQNEVITQLTSAWTHRPTRNIIKSLWDRIEVSEGDEQNFIETLNDITKYLVPESLSLSVSVSQRIYALTKLHELSIVGTETQLQALLESFPWILGSDKGKVYANTALKELARKAILDGVLPGHADTSKQLADSANAGTRPDFAFFSDANKSTIIIVELKSPQVPLQYEHVLQLLTYYYWMKSHYPTSKITGYLVGKNAGSGIECDDPNIHVKTWDQICLHSRKDYLELLASMLNGISEHYDDSRVYDVIELGGEATKELLKKMADVNTPLSEFFENIDKKLRLK
ncbi:TPA: ATP-binding protein [Klebsiella pneumoniae]|uniref:ATP-binding protein n=1 Tax=Klebsiella pneumoniae TaxID=573 RepID=UPI0022750B4E|nr:ATP-binding protein [Klebsiella pneumoniae subsp. pneumoniae]HDY8525343.1 ATP-binding protein [Klebsiella pneumoniae]